MKISSCYPQYAANDYSMAVDYLKNRQGFNVIHNNSLGVHRFCTLENDKGYRVDVINVPGAIDGFHSTRLNVDDLNDAVGFFKMQGYETECDIVQNPELIMVFMSKDGAGRICLMQHIKSN